MNRTFVGIAVSGGVVVVGIALAVGVGLFRGGDSNPASDPALLPAAGASVPAEAAPAALTEAGSVDWRGLQPHLEDEATAQSADEERQPAPAPAEATPAVLALVAVTVRELTSGRTQYAGREVTLTGRILTLGVGGCQLTLDDGTGVMPVELVGDALTNTIPLRSMGRRIEVTGVFRLAPRLHVAVERPDGWRFR